jgi:hypothetical protein
MSRELPRTTLQNYAPVVFFAYNRPRHTSEALRSLASNDLASKTDLIAYLDGPKTEKDRLLVAEVKAVIEKTREFKSVTLIQRGKNIGLARNIIDGIGSVIQKHGRVIVVEDDLLVSPAFLRYMNDALVYYEEKTTVWHIAGFTEDIGRSNVDESFFWRTMYCWGWATWKDRWQHFEKNPSNLVKRFDSRMIKRFNLDGANDFWSQVLANEKKILDTWAIFWYATIFQNDGLCLNPYVSYVRNVGFDGSGIHCENDSLRQAAPPLNMMGIFCPPAQLVESAEAVEQLKNYFTRRRGNGVKRRIRYIYKIFVSALRTPFRVASLRSNRES